MIIPHISENVKLYYVLYEEHAGGWSNNLMYRVSFRGLYCSSLIFIPDDSRKINFLIRFITTIYLPSFRRLRLYHIVELYGVNSPIAQVSYSQRDTAELLRRMEECHNFLRFLYLFRFLGSSSPTSSTPDDGMTEDDAGRASTMWKAHECGSDSRSLLGKKPSQSGGCLRLFDHKTHKNPMNSHFGGGESFSATSILIRCSCFRCETGGWNKVPVSGSFGFITFFNMLFLKNIQRILNDLFTQWKLALRYNTSEELGYWGGGRRDDEWSDPLTLHTRNGYPSPSYGKTFRWCFRNRSKRTEFISEIPPKI